MQQNGKGGNHVGLLKFECHTQYTIDKSTTMGSLE